MSNQPYRGQPLLAAEVPLEEPVVTRAIVVAAVTAALTLLVSFGVPISDAQQTAILGFIAVVAPLVLAALARRKTFSPATTKRLLGERPSPR